MFLRCWMCKGQWVSFRSWRKNICCKRCIEDLQRKPADPALVEAVRTMDEAIPAPSSIPSEFYGSPFNVAGWAPLEEPVRKPKPDDYASSESIRFASLPEPITITYDWSTSDTGTISTDSSPSSDSDGSSGSSSDFSGGGGDFGGGGASGDW